MKRSVCYDTVIKSVTRYRGKEINILRDKKMETKVTFIYDYQNIELPEPLVKLTCGSTQADISSSMTSAGTSSM